MTVQGAMKLMSARVAALLARAGMTGPALLNMVDRLTPGGSRVDRQVAGAAYGPDPRQRLDLWRAADAGDAPQPVLLFFYGGSWSAGDRRDYGFAARAYARHGFTVIVHDYRLVPHVHFPDFVQDGAAAIGWIADHVAGHGGDPRRIVLAGHSAGAHIAMLLALDRHYVVDRGIDPSWIRAAAGFAGPYDFLPFDVPASIAAFSRAPLPLQTQPVHFAGPDSPPLWLATGGADRIVMPRNSRALATAIRFAGGEAVHRDYPGLDHADLVIALARPFRRKAPVLAESAAFLMKGAIATD